MYHQDDLYEDYGREPNDLSVIAQAVMMLLAVPEMVMNLIFATATLLLAIAEIVINLIFAAIFVYVVASFFHLF